MNTVAQRLRQQVRVYANLIEQGDRIAVVVGRTKSRDQVLDHLLKYPDLRDIVQVIRARGRWRDGPRSDS